MPAQPSAMSCTIYFTDNNGGGWSERYGLAETDYDSALAQGAKLLEFRRALLATSMSIKYSRVGFHGSPPDGIKLKGRFPLASSPITAAADTVNLSEDALIVRYDLSSGQKAFRPIRAMPDHFIADNSDTIFNTLHSIPVAVPNKPSFGTWQQRLDDFLKYTLNHTRRNKKNPAAGATDWLVDQWVRTYVYKVKSRRIGRPFGLSAARARATVPAAPPS